MKLEPANIVCPACGNANYMRHLIGKNVGHLNLKCINCNSYFNFDELYKWRMGEALKPKPITNADRIRMMMDEELEKWIEQLESPKCPCDDWFYRCEKWNCNGCWLKWLKQECEQ